MLVMLAARLGYYSWIVKVSRRVLTLLSLTIIRGTGSIITEIVSGDFRLACLSYLQLW